MTYLFISCGLFDWYIHVRITRTHEINDTFTWLICPLIWRAHIHDLCMSFMCVFDFCIHWNEWHIYMTYVFISCGLFDWCVHIRITRTHEINDTYAWLIYPLIWRTHMHNVSIPFMWSIWLMYPLKWITHIHLCIHFMWPIWLMYSYTCHTYTAMNAYVLSPIWYEMWLRYVIYHNRISHVTQINEPRYIYAIYK